MAGIGSPGAAPLPGQRVAGNAAGAPSRTAQAAAARSLHPAPLLRVPGWGQAGRHWGWRSRRRRPRRWHRCDKRPSQQPARSPPDYTCRGAAPSCSPMCDTSRCVSPDAGATSSTSAGAANRSLLSSSLRMRPSLQGAHSMGSAGGASFSSECFTEKSCCTALVYEVPAGCAPRLQTVIRRQQCHLPPASCHPGT